ncbi:UDP-glucuronosyltransferase 1-7 [Trichoplax sp. H2]|nr:UDP-glucuronosyltransferase 1-7 [Trichoplax sp. H2]|eukprot:RDD42316.1 UDP-glucuronosyltransferase 1-7 [Trichoplax sp. H2]
MGIKLLVSIAFIALSIAFRLQNAHCAKVAVIPAFEKRHVLVLNTFAEALHDRGHDIQLFLRIVEKPHIILGIGALNVPRLLLNNPQPLSYVPILLTSYSSMMTFKERFINAIAYAMLNKFYSYALDQNIGSLKHKFDNTASMTTYEIENSVSMVLMTGDFVLEYSRPLLPNVKVIGTFSAKPAKPLSSDLEVFMNGERKVVYISFGSIYENFDAEKIKVFIDAVNRIPYKVVWKSKASVKDVGSHVKIVNWAPQNDILGMPISADQIDNAKQVVRAGLGIEINIRKLTSNDIDNGIARVTTDRSNLLFTERYQENAKHISTAIHSQRRSPQDTAVGWAEYIIANKGAKHLRMEGYKLSIVEFYMLDVALAWIIIIMTVIYLIKRFTQFIYFRC